MIVFQPMEFAPELSIRSGGVPPTKRGCSSVAIFVEGETLTVTPSRPLLFSISLAAFST